MKRKLAILLSALLLLCVTGFTTQASAGVLGYNQSVNGYLAAGSLESWTFYGNMGEVIEATAVSDQFDPLLALIDPYGRPLAIAANDGDVNTNGYVSLTLPAAGAYELVVQSESAGGGYFLLSLNLVRPRTPAYVYYRNGFDGYAGYEWSPAMLGWTPTGRGFLGPLGSQGTTLTLSNLPAHDAVTLDFDLYVINSWDGNNATPGLGPDQFSVYWGNQNVTLLATTFSNYQYSNQSYPAAYGAGDNPPGYGAVEIGTLGYTPVGVGDFGSSVYHLTFNLTSTDNWLQFSFFGQVLEGVGNESWGIDNVRVFLSNTAYYAPISFCANSPATTLRPGMHLATNGVYNLQVSPWISEVFAQMRLGRQLLILDGPACVNGRNWWLVEIEENGNVGWLPETDPAGNPMVYRRTGTNVDPVTWLPLAPATPGVEALHREEVNIRDIPSTETGVILDRASRGEELLAFAQTANGRWLNVIFTNNRGAQQTGWICTDLVRTSTGAQHLPVVEGTVNENCRGEVWP